MLQIAKLPRLCLKTWCSDTLNVIGSAFIELLLLGLLFSKLKMHSEVQRIFSGFKALSFM